MLYSKKLEGQDKVHSNGERTKSGDLGVSVGSRLEGPGRDETVYLMKKKSRSKCSCRNFYI